MGSDAGSGALSFVAPGKGGGRSLGGATPPFQTGCASVALESGGKFGANAASGAFSLVGDADGGMFASIVGPEVVDGFELDVELGAAETVCSFSASCDSSSSHSSSGSSLSSRATLLLSIALATSAAKFSVAAGLASSVFDFSATAFLVTIGLVAEGIGGSFGGVGIPDGCGRSSVTADAAVSLFAVMLPFGSSSEASFVEGTAVPAFFSCKSATAFPRSAMLSLPGVAIGT